MTRGMKAIDGTYEESGSTNSRYKMRECTAYGRDVQMIYWWAPNGSISATPVSNKYIEILELSHQQKAQLRQCSSSAAVRAFRSGNP